MKRLTELVLILLLSLICLGSIGCSGDEPPEKTTIEKLNSDDQEEQEQGLDEANEKYGAGR